MARARRIIVVLGMHRSGTSAATRLASLLGAALPSDLMPPVEGINETGFWESEAVVTLNDEMLGSVGATWDSITPFPAGWFGSEAAGVFRERAKALLREETEGESLLVLKDPRLCRLVPIWSAAIEGVGARASFIHVLRHPLEVAASLDARDRFARPKSLLLWLRHVLEAERTTRGNPRSFVTYEDLLSDWQLIAARLSRELRLRWRRPARQAASEVNSFLQPSHRHHEFDDADMEKHFVPRLVRMAHETLTAATTGAGEPDPRILDACHEDLERADELYSDLQKQTREELRALEGYRDETLRLQASLNETDGRLQAARTEFADQIARSRAAADQFEALNASLESRVEKAEEAARSAASRLQARDHDVERLTDQLSGRDREVQHLEGRLAVREFEVRRLERAVAALDSRLRRAEAEHRSQCVAVLGALDATAG